MTEKSESTPEEKADKVKAKIEKMRFLKKLIIFCFSYIIVFTVSMIVIYCVKGDYPETLVTVTFAYFGVEAVISAGIKIFEKKPKSDSYSYGNYTDYPNRDYEDYNK